eukprot:4149372-Prorocentrum_lima.AAC.1
MAVRADASGEPSSSRGGGEPQRAGKKRGDRGLARGTTPPGELRTGDAPRLCPTARRLRVRQRALRSFAERSKAKRGWRR